MWVLVCEALCEVYISHGMRRSEHRKRTKVEAAWLCLKWGVHATVGSRAYLHIHGSFPCFRLFKIYFIDHVTHIQSPQGTGRHAHVAAPGVYLLSRFSSLWSNLRQKIVIASYQDVTVRITRGHASGSRVQACRGENWFWFRTRTRPTWGHVPRTCWTQDLFWYFKLCG